MNAVKGANTLFSQKLEFDKTGNIVKQISAQYGIAPINFEYTYDNINRLRLWKTHMWAAGEEFIYDSVGNRKSQAVFMGSDAAHHTNMYEYGNGNNQLTQVTNPFTSVTTKYQYTGDGALRVRSSEHIINLAYQGYTRELFKYSYNGLLKTFSSGSWSAETLDCSRDTTLPLEWEWQYRYSAGGERESKRNTIAPLDGIMNTSHLWTYYLLGGNKQQLAVYNGRETDVTDVCMNTGHRVHFYPTEYLTYGNGMSALITTRPDFKQEYKIVDHLGSTRVVLNDTGKVISQYDFEPFGKPIALTGLNSRKSYIDKEHDKESESSNYGVRQYDPVTGRFYSTDPMWEEADQINLQPYHYCANNPLTFSDADGLHMNGKGIEGNMIPAKENAKNLAESAAKAGSQFIKGDVLGGLWTLAKGSLSYIGHLDYTGISVGIVETGGAKVAEKVAEKVAPTSNAARREAMRDAGIPTSQQPASQSKNASGRSYEYEVGGQKKTVQQQTKDRSHDQKHWEAGGVQKTKDGLTKQGNYGRPKIEQEKAKVYYHDVK